MVGRGKWFTTHNRSVVFCTVGWWHFTHQCCDV